MAAVKPSSSLLQTAIMETFKNLTYPDLFNSVSTETLGLKEVLATISTKSGRDSWEILLLSAAILLLTLACVSSSPSSIKVPIPLSLEVKSKRQRQNAYCFDSRNTLSQGYKLYKNKPFGVDSTDGIKLIVPRCFLDKLKSHQALSFEKSIDTDLLRTYTGIGGVDVHGVRLLTAKFNPTLPGFVPQLHDLIRKRLPEVLGTHKDWEPVNINHPLTAVVAKASASVMHSKEASDNETWLRIIQEHLEAGVAYGQQLKQWPPFLRPLVCRFIPQRKEVFSLVDEARQVVQNTLDAKKAGLAAPSTPPTILDHLTMGDAAGNLEKTEDMLERQLLLAVASIHTTSSSTVHTLYFLSAHPEYVEELREEVRTVLESCGGTFTRDGLNRLEKLDSFMKESQRLSSPDLTTFQRISLQTLTLPDGTYVPAKTKMEIATSAINVDEELFENPNQFDGFRFYRRRQAGEKNLTYTSVGQANLGWGVGRHACPGRFFAEIEIKLMIAELLLHYDIKNPEGQGRFANMEFEAVVFPNPEAAVLLKSLD